jgi:hypothetical protein
MGRSSARSLAELIFRLVDLTMPAEHRQWARAMRAEAAYVGSDAAALGFAAGCLWVAVAEYFKMAARKNSAVMGAGLCAGFVFFAHASVDGSGAWPVLWPLLGGAGTALVSARNSRRLDLPGAAWLGLRAGLVAGLLFAAGGIALLSASEQVTVGSRLPVLVVAAVAGALLSAIGASTATLLVRIRG